MGNFPNQPNPGFTVGFSGHRWNKITADAAPRIALQLSAVLAEVDDAVRRKFRIENAAGSRAPMVRLICNLAEGADLMAVSSRPAGWPLHAILPFSLARYENDFAPAHATGGVDRRAEFRAALAQAESIVELPDVNDAVQGYERAGQCMLEQSSLLVAVWDGQPAAGRGGTQAVISQAVAAAIPVIWIHSDREQAPVLLLSAVPSAQELDAQPADPGMIDRTVSMIVRASRARCPSSTIEPEES